MSRLALILSFLLGPLTALLLPQPVQASYTSCSDPTLGSVKVTSNNLGDTSKYKEEEIKSLEITLDTSKMEIGEYKARLFDTNDVFGRSNLQDSEPFTVARDQPAVATLQFTDQDKLTGLPTSAFSVGAASELFGEDIKYIHLYKKGATGLYTVASYCYLGYYSIVNDWPSCTDPIIVKQIRDTDEDPATPPKECIANNDQSCVDTSAEFQVIVTGLVGANGNPYSGLVNFTNLSGLNKAQWTDSPGELTFTHKFEKRTHDVAIVDVIGRSFEGPCKVKFTVWPRCNVGDSCSSKPPTNKPNEGSGGGDTYLLCAQISDVDLKQKCVDCAGGTAEAEEGQGVWTAVGCIKKDAKSIVSSFVQIGLGLGGGLCLLTCLAGGFLITTSQGEPTKINEAKDMIKNALIGLLFIIFSVVILQFIGVTILNIPGFGTTPTP